MEGLDGLQGLGMLGEISKGEHLEQITSVSLSESPCGKLTPLC